MKRFNLIFLAILFFFGFSLTQGLISIYPTILWFDNLGFTSVFWTNLWAKIWTGVGFGLLFLIITGINLFIAKRLTKDLKVERARSKSNPEFNVQKMIKDLFGEGGDDGDDNSFINITLLAK